MTSKGMEKERNRSIINPDRAGSTKRERVKTITSIIVCSWNGIMRSYLVVFGGWLWYCCSLVVLKILEKERILYV